MTNAALRQASARLKDWTVDSALPFWAERGRDDQGGWFEHLHLDGRPDKEAVRRHRIHARQAYVYAAVTKAGWYDGLDVARQSFDFMCRYGEGRDGKPGFIHRLGPDLSVASDLRDFYDHAFYLLACASLYGLTGADAYLDKAESILAFIDSLKSKNGGWVEGVPARLPRRQNPHMHLFEASMALHRSTGRRRDLSHARSVYGLFQRYFFDEDHHRIREFFSHDWAIVKGDRSATAEPGHAVEWVWLLAQFEELTGTDTASYRNALYDTALRQRGYFLNDEEDISGNIRRETKRLWVQTELVKAHLAQAENGVPGAADMAAAAMDGLFGLYLKNDGTWHDQINACLTPVAKTIPVSTFYHIACMALEAERVAGLA